MGKETNLPWQHFFFSFLVVEIRSPEEDHNGKVTLHSTRLDSDLTCLLSPKMADKYG